MTIITIIIIIIIMMLCLECVWWCGCVCVGGSRHSESYRWPELDENTASSLCYTSGTYQE